MSGTVIGDALTALTDEIPRVDDIRAERVCLGLGYTGVKLDTGHAGLCYTLQRETWLRCCQASRRAGTLAGSRAVELANLAASWDIGERVVGVASLNALSQIVLEGKPKRYLITRGNLIEDLEIGGRDVVALVGNIRPFVSVIKEKAKELYVLERNPMLREEGVLPSEACEEVLPRADIVIITGSALANGTIDRLLELSSRAREVALVGASASLIPEPLFKRGVTAVGCVRIPDPDWVMRIVAEGGGTHQLRAAVDFIVVRPRV
ncbi:MAG: Rossmann-like domain-containing protein [Candidatus Geothermarchaeales archaeon]